MFFKKLKKEFLVLNLFSLTLFVILYFSLINNNFYKPEYFSYFNNLKSLGDLKNLFLPFTLITYFLFSYIVISSLNKLNNKVANAKDYKFYFYSSVIYLILYFIVVFLTILLCKNILKFNLQHAVTDTSLFIWISTSIIFCCLLLKTLTYIKLQTRIEYFKTKGQLKISSYFSGFKMLFKFKHILLFIVITTFFAFIPVLLILYSIYSNLFVLGLLSLVLSIIFFTTGKLVLYYAFFRLNNRLLPDKKSKQKKDVVKKNEVKMENKPKRNRKKKVLNKGKSIKEKDIEIEIKEDETSDDIDFLN